MVNPLNMRLSLLAPTLARDGANITKAGGSLKVQIESGMTLHTSNSKLLFRLGLFVSPTTDYCLPPFGFVRTLVNWRLTTDLCLLALFFQGRRRAQFVAIPYPHSTCPSFHPTRNWVCLAQQPCS
jgi:hypothetical protein